MTIISDGTLIQGNINIPGRPIIEPFINHLVRRQADKKVISYGLSSCGYDVRLDYRAQIFSNHLGGIVDPKNFHPDNLVDASLHNGESGHYFLLPPNSYLLGSTIETFDIPNGLMVLCIGKSTYARCGLIVNVTPIEPGFIGQVVIEIANSTSLPVRVYANEGIAQFVFFESDKPSQTTYADRGGKYQNQVGITHAKA